ncbi:MAG TPA: sulfotransferase [Myxococcota bacterium]|nr:sulfotransferase [Myxococcota bacterium]
MRGLLGLRPRGRAPAAERPLGVLVVGMHRSGTSVVAEILQALGLFVGTPDTLIGPSRDNGRGHFELSAGVELDNELLREAGGTWDAPPPAEALEALAARIRPPIESWFAGHPAFAFKDPRLCLTLPSWMPALAAVDVRLVHVMREPHAVARSLVARNAARELPASHFARGEMRMAEALSLWAEYNRRACVYAERFGVPRLVVWYDALLDDRRSQVRRIAAFVGRGSRRIGRAARCVRQELRRSGD